MRRCQGVYEEINERMINEGLKLESQLSKSFTVAFLHLSTRLIKNEIFIFHSPIDAALKYHC